ncbi:MAG: Bifunctional dehydrogenase and ferrochelatase [Cyphobasidiales sp. Tagirdzhanova-0007]|nr:MAG: Bifunctional dehydrogenase and ferrochelatase [Cyphobasidiales sp. Tagirdzhanova-0007]
MDVRERNFKDEDVLDEEWDMVLTALDDPALSKHIYSLCKKRHFNINVADVPPLCDFYFGSVIRRGPLQVMISTNENVGEAIERIGGLRAGLRKRAPGSDAETVKRRMEWMVRVTDSWTLDELAGMKEEEQQSILSSWDGDFAPSYTSTSGKYWRRALCPYWIVQTLFNPVFWWHKGQVDSETLEERRQTCPAYRAKSSVGDSNVLYWISGGTGAIVGGLAVVAAQHARARYLR